MNGLINFVDLAPTLCSIAGVQIPDYMQGKAFLGNQKTKDPEYVYMARERMDERYDNVSGKRPAVQIYTKLYAFPPHYAVFTYIVWTSFDAIMGK
ncbi:MAG: hypothetical protein IPI69_07225 [Bacteroidales bacterium]|nr:hypothetical protein [Bacteroidales bacterium]